ncbi:hypothetical protein PENTCL1PPCAC_16085 [Pristionchus entomophagus]|uniref:Glutathione S-transferase kappa n=1 Tax=Pristionchus entomophagus TaxID=358040 RepID=A0AAV5THT2_9BILA|nr:hypothetical protein PENTCL1PPCAC_16085 [Pristionchus entomophagus]
MAKKFAVDLYFDILSPYSYIIYRSKWPMQVTLKPFALQHIFKATGNTSPGLAAAYSERDVIRMSRFHNIPLKIRDDFITIIQTKSSLNANRLICAVQLAQPEKGEAVARALYRRLWVDQADIFQNEDFLEVLSSCGVICRHSIVSSIASEKVKAIIKKNTDEAVESGCFGAPWTVLTLANGRKEAFFGSDRLHVIGDLMGCTFDGPLTSTL